MDQTFLSSRGIQLAVSKRFNSPLELCFFPLNNRILRPCHFSVFQEIPESAGVSLNADRCGLQKGAKKLRKIYPGKESARHAATAERSRIKRAPATLDMKLALGRPDTYLEALVTASGLKAEIDSTEWLITEVTHRFDSGGHVTDLKMGTAG